MKKIIICLSIFVSSSLIAMEEIVSFEKKTDSNRPVHTIDTRLENLDTLRTNSKKGYSYIVFIPSKLNLKFRGHYVGTSDKEKGFIESFDATTKKENTYYAFYEDNLIVEKDNTDNIVQEATHALTSYEKQWANEKGPDFALNLAAYTLFKKIIDTYPEQINQPSLAMAHASYKAWEKHGQKIRHQIPFAYEIFEQQGKNNCF